MDWFWRKIGQDDPLKDIDPALREYLKKQTPHTYKPESATPEPRTYSEQLSQTPPPPPTSTTPSVPSQSLYPDGRYAHLWATYRPQADVEEASKTEQDRLHDIVGAFQDRQSTVKEAALENCADLQLAVHDCFRSGGWRDRMSMCRAQNRALERCMTLQGQFLRALGYAAMRERTAADAEKIQMHADTLYQEMLRRERVTEEARKEGREEPVFGDIFAAAPKVQDATGVRFETLPVEIREKLAKERFEGLSGVELALAKRQLEQEIELNQEAVTRLRDFYTRQRKERLERKEKGEESVGDRVTRWFDMRDWSWVDKAEQPVDGKK